MWVLKERDENKLALDSAAVWLQKLKQSRAQGNSKELMNELVELIKSTEKKQSPRVRYILEGLFLDAIHADHEFLANLCLSFPPVFINKKKNTQNERLLNFTLDSLIKSSKISPEMGSKFCKTLIQKTSAATIDFPLIYIPAIIKEFNEKQRKEFFANLDYPTFLEFIASKIETKNPDNLTSIVNIFSDLLRHGKNNPKINNCKEKILSIIEKISSLQIGQVKSNAEYDAECERINDAFSSILPAYKFLFNIEYQKEIPKKEKFSFLSFISSLAKKTEDEILVGLEQKVNLIASNLSGLGQNVTVMSDLYSPIKDKETLPEKIDKILDIMAKDKNPETTAQAENYLSIFLGVKKERITSEFVEQLRQIRAKDKELAKKTNQAWIADISYFPFAATRLQTSKKDIVKENSVSTQAYGRCATSLDNQIFINPNNGKLVGLSSKATGAVFNNFSTDSFSMPSKKNWVVFSLSQWGELLVPNLETTKLPETLQFSGEIKVENGVITGIGLLESDRFANLDTLKTMIDKLKTMGADLASCKVYVKNKTPTKSNAMDSAYHQLTIEAFLEKTKGRVLRLEQGIYNLKAFLKLKLAPKFAGIFDQKLIRELLKELDKIHLSGQSAETTLAQLKQCFVSASQHLNGQPNLQDVWLKQELDAIAARVDCCDFIQGQPHFIPQFVEQFLKLDIKDGRLPFVYTITSQDQAFTKDFNVVGWGCAGNGGKAQMETSLLQNTNHSSDKPVVRFSLGDNFYRNGVTDKDDKAFNKLFYVPYGKKGSKIDRIPTPTFVATGNHDHNFSAENKLDLISSAVMRVAHTGPLRMNPQIEHTFDKKNDINGAFHQKNRYGGTVELEKLNTFNMFHNAYTVELGKTDFIIVDSSRVIQDLLDFLRNPQVFNGYNNQVAWLYLAIKKHNPERPKVLCWHHPIKTWGGRFNKSDLSKYEIKQSDLDELARHGFVDNSGLPFKVNAVNLNTLLLHFLEKLDLRVDALWCAHDHDQYVAVQLSPVVPIQIVAGGGGGKRQARACPDKVEFFVKEHGYSCLNISKDGHLLGFKIYGLESKAAWNFGADGKIIIKPYPDNNAETLRQALLQACDTYYSQTEEVPQKQELEFFSEVSKKIPRKLEHKSMERADALKMHLVAEGDKKVIDLVLLLARIFYRDFPYPISPKGDSLLSFVNSKIFPSFPVEPKDDAYVVFDNALKDIIMTNNLGMKLTLALIDEIKKQPKNTSEDPKDNSDYSEPGDNNDNVMSDLPSYGT